MSDYFRAPVATDPPAQSEPALTEEKNFGELQISEYIVFLLALDTYMRYLAETVGEDKLDDVTTDGIQLLRLADRLHIDAIEAFLKTNLPSDTHRKMLAKALRIPSNAKGAPRRALQFRLLLSRGGSPTMRAVFETNKALLNVRAAIAAAMIDDADAALDKFAVIQMKNVRLRNWIDRAAESAGSGTPPTALTAATQAGVSDDVKELLKEKVVQSGGSVTSIDGANAGQRQDAILARVQSEAEETARKTLQTAKLSDDPPSKSEVIGIATAAAVAAMSDPSLESNLPRALQGLAEEKRAAILSDGKVRVAAGAGSGKTTALVARVRYLLENRKVAPESIMATSFNKKAADELREKIAKAIGNTAAQAMTIGTMHGTFLRFINEFGESFEKEMFRSVSIPNPRNPKEKVQGGGLTSDARIMGAVMRAWKECFPPPPDGAEVADKDLWKMPPKLRRMKAYLNKFQGQGWSLKEAQVWAKSQGAPPPEWIQAVMFYELYEGFKGALGPNWRPRLCKEAPRAYDKFVKEVKFGKSRVADFSDMLIVFRNILRRNEGARKTLQGTFKHIMVDECQDLNPVQFEVFKMMSQHISTDDTDRSFWMVGDDKQSIYQFRGSDPQQFKDLEEKEGFKNRLMETNFRSLPEIVECANQLIAHNENQIKMVARANPEKPYGKASILVESPEDTASAAISFGARVKKAMLAGDPLCEFAVLARTNAELHDFETGCIIRGIPYVRKNSSSFLGSYESQVAMSFIDFATADSNEVMQDNFAKVIYHSSRFLIKGSPDQFENTLKGVFTRYCMANRVDKKDFNPLVALMNDSEFGFDLVKAITGATLRPGEEWKAEKDLDQLTDLLSTLAELRGKVTEDGYTTKDLLNDILSIEGMELVLDDKGRMVRKPITLKDKIVRQLASKVSDEDEEEDDSSTEGEEPLGALAFFYAMMEVDPTELDLDPSKPIDFRIKIDRFKARATDLRIDPSKWEKEQRALPLDKREKPPGVYLGTVHSVKGAEWQDVTTLMPKGRFPIEFKPKKAKKNDVPEIPLMAEAERLESERRLGYVALTRAIKNLTVVCPKVVNNQPAGMSPFVIEAGLKEGENVGVGGTHEVVKTASEEFSDDLGAYLQDFDVVASEVIEPVKSILPPVPPASEVAVDLAERVATRIAQKSEWK